MGHHVPNMLFVLWYYLRVVRVCVQRDARPLHATEAQHDYATNLINIDTRFSSWYAIVYYTAYRFVLAHILQVSVYRLYRVNVNILYYTFFGVWIFLEQVVDVLVFSGTDCELEYYHTGNIYSLSWFERFGTTVVPATTLFFVAARVVDKLVGRESEDSKELS